MGQGTESLASQVGALLAGKLVIPSIQRGYVWRRSQVPYLLDSLYKGYPVEVSESDEAGTGLSHQ